jgi:tRNA (guanine-N7-)-methyltransferase
MNRTMPPIQGQEAQGGRAPRRSRRDLEPGPFGLTTETAPRPSTSHSLFSDERPLELEVGSGKGTFLVAESRKRPEVNFLGIEYARRYWRFAADRLRRNECDNARVVLAEASSFLREFLLPDSLSGVHIYFPDPWPKSRHHRRRLLQAPFVELLSTRMRPGARLQIATDHHGYFEQIARTIAASSLVVVPFDALASAGDEELVGSNFERKYRKERRELNVLAAIKPD